MFEHKKKPLATPREFVKRTLKFFGFSLSIITFSLFLGMFGYHRLAGISWTDAFYNASMILTGMGPALDIDQLPVDCQTGVKLFAGFYALYSGVVFLAATGLLLSPVIHRFFHKLHLDVD
jgi:hypothetical protein